MTAKQFQRIVEREMSAWPDDQISPRDLFTRYADLKSKLMQAGATLEQLGQWACGCADTCARDSELSEDQRGVVLTVVQDALGFDLQLKNVSSDRRKGMWTYKARSQGH